MNTSLLYLMAVAIWGPTYYVVNFQLGVVDPLLSVSYRFMLAGFLLLGFCHLTKMSLIFSIRSHLFMLLQGVSLFGVNYWLMYQGTEHLTSGLVALIFSTIVMMNIFNSALFLAEPVRKQVVAGGLLGLVGIALVFQPDSNSLVFGGLVFQALVLLFLSVYCESLGNITSAHNQKKMLPVVQTNAFSMTYGGVVMLLMAWLMGKPIIFDTSSDYLLSLFYLSVFGSIIGFGCYLTLVGRIGADKAAYITLLVPIVALLVSTWLEGYQWSSSSLAGVGFVLMGNLIVLISPHQYKQFNQRWRRVSV